MIIDDPETRDDDWLLFVDGDAFPVVDVTAYGSEKLAQYPLVAVQRFENNEDIQPHPCFCMMTVAYWRDIKATWKPGFHWTNPQGQQITDIGGELLGLLQERGDDRSLMLRSNCAKYHPGIFRGLRRPGLSSRGRIPEGLLSQSDQRYGEGDGGHLFLLGSWRHPSPNEARIP